MIDELRDDLLERGAVERIIWMRIAHCAPTNTSSGARAIPRSLIPLPVGHASEQDAPLLSMPSHQRPVAAQYVATFLKPEMLHIYRQIRALNTWRPVVFCQKREHEQEFPWRDAVIIPKPRTHQLRRFYYKTLLCQPIVAYPSEARRIWRRMDALDPDLLHIYFGHIAAYLRPMFPYCLLPVVVSFHGADAAVNLEKRAHAEVQREVFAKATLLLARSQSLLEQLATLGAPRDKLRLQRTGIPLDEFHFSARNAPEDGAWHCIQACRLIAKKGLRTTLTAFASFSTKYPRALLTIAGEGPLRMELESFAARLGIADRVRFVGFLQQDELQALYASAHFFLHPSETTAEGDREGVPNALLEAMATGLPAVATRHGGIPEAVADGVSGCLVAEGDAEALAAALMQLAAVPARYAQMSVAARERVAAEFDSAAQARHLEALYDEAAGLAQAQSTR
jgi:colanic acid/amylovoran biosynthesis glycosyltransferase